MSRIRQCGRTRSLYAAFTLCVFSACHCPIEAAVAPCIVNAVGQTYDSHPSMAVAADGTAWMVWHAYDKGCDRILSRYIDAKGNAGPVQTVSQKGRVHGPPTLAFADEHTLWIVWSAKVNDLWQVLARCRSADGWGDTIVVSAKTHDAIYPNVTFVGGKRLLVSWSAQTDGRFRLFIRVYEEGVWHKPVPVSPPTEDAYRSVFAVEDSHAAWLFWDAYDGHRYAVKGRRLLPHLGPIERTSPENTHCLMPTTLATDNGLYVAWLQKKDVIGGPGAISQWHELNMAVRTEQKWNVISDAEGNTCAAELTQGLMAQIEPKPVATWGYLGRRTQPMLLEEDGDVWLLWERKSDHLGSTYRVTGDLVGRPMRNRHWQQPVVLHRGRVDYRLSQPHRVKDGEFVFVASQLPRQRRRLYHRLAGRLDEATEFKQDQWVGWRPVDLPIQNELTERRTIQVDERRYTLYWADLHCHSSLSADAEGAPDELTYYARDRARLDVVVFTENDFLYNVPLTEYEYEFGNLLARAYTQEGRFLSFPGYEWTSRVPGDRAASLDDPGNWTPPYNKGTHANHRSVILPPSTGSLLRHPEVSNDITKLNNMVAQAGGITLTQHDRFRASDHEVEVGMELVSGWGNYIARRPQSFFDALNQGSHLACVANGDTHRRAPGLSGGLTGIFAEELTVDAILDALRQRRCYGTTGSRIFLDSRANGSLMGQSIRAITNRIELTLKAIGTRPITLVTLIRNGTPLKVFPAAGHCDFRATYEDSDLTQGNHWYLWRVSQERAAPSLPGNVSVAHGHLAWSSPHWVIVE